MTPKVADESEGYEPPKTIYCVQLYTSTPDYELIVDEAKGLGMYTNRRMAADEIIVQSAVGPMNSQTLLTASPLSEELSTDRKSFAERFLAWQSTYGSSDAVGTTEDRVEVSLKDFYNPPSADSEYSIPTGNDGSYCFYFGLKRNDIVLVEFADGKNYNNNVAFPAERRFEELPYDEALVFNGEKNYNPSRLKRPPTLSSQQTRELEIPGHFSNHACGKSATGYDHYRLNDDCSSISCPIVAPAQSECLNKALEEYVRTKTFPPELKYVSPFTTRIPLEKGIELTSDYSLWHWCNVDYIPDGPHSYDPNVSEAYRTDLSLEEEEERYGDWTDPWFHCLCGDENCHSSIFGFRGVKFFDLEEQKRLYWVCSPWIQNQIDWKHCQLEKTEWGGGVVLDGRLRMVKLKGDGMNACMLAIVTKEMGLWTIITMLEI